MSNVLPEQKKGKALQTTDIAKIQDLRHSGLSIDEIAERFRIEPWVVKMVLRMYD